MEVRTYDYGYTKIQGAETRFIKRIVFLIKTFLEELTVRLTVSSLKKNLTMN